MASDGLSDELVQFIFENIDSVEILEVLLLLRAKSGQYMNAEMINAELRANVESIKTRLAHLIALGLIKNDSENSLHFRYAPATPELSALVDSLAEGYKIRRQKIFSIIFSPAKRMRDFAEAFVVRDRKKDNSDG